MNSNLEIVRLCAVAFALVNTVVSQNLPPIQPISFILPNPPVLAGPLSVNQALRSAEKVAENKINGPSSFVSIGGSLFAGTIDNKIYDIAACQPRLVASLSPPGCNSIHTCGQLTSLKRDPVTGGMLALVNFIGLIHVDPSTGNTNLLYSARTPINGRLPVYLTDFVAFQDGTLVLADASDAYAYPNDIYICMDSRPRGRLLSLTRGTGEIVEILPNTFVHPTSLEVTPGGDILVSEACRARIRKVSLQTASLLDVTAFTTNLPGLPDDIRATSRGTYWVALRMPRHSTLRRNPMDLYSQMPNYRLQGTQWMGRQELENYWSTWAIVIELDAMGRPIGSLHDPQGITFQRPTSVTEIDGVLYIGSDKTKYAGRVILPETSTRKIKIDAFLQVLLSRCVISPEEAVPLKARLLQQYPQLA